MFAGTHRRALPQVFVLMSGAWLVNNMVSAVMPGLLKSHLGFSATQTTIVLMIESAVVAVSFPLLGAFSQRIGRRRFYIGYGLLMAVGGSLAYTALMTAGFGFDGTLVLTTLVGLTTIGAFGPIAAYLTERFPAKIRASGYGVGYSLALIIPAFYAFYLSGIGTLVPTFIAPVVLVALSGVLVAFGGWLGPETRNVDMQATGNAIAAEPVGEPGRQEEIAR